MLHPRPTILHLRQRGAGQGGEEPSPASWSWAQACLGWPPRKSCMHWVAKSSCWKRGTDLGGVVGPWSPMTLELRLPLLPHVKALKVLTNNPWLEGVWTSGQLGSMASLIIPWLSWLGSRDLTSSFLRRMLPSSAVMGSHQDRMRNRKQKGSSTICSVRPGTLRQASPLPHQRLRQLPGPRPPPRSLRQTNRLGRFWSAHWFLCSRHHSQPQHQPLAGALTVPSTFLKPLCRDSCWGGTLLALNTPTALERTSCPHDTGRWMMAMDIMTAPRACLAQVEWLRWLELWLNHLMKFDSTQRSPLFATTNR
mmetsp:Transcript_61083/g.164138  ORF Transcript_61083/g.164138 Transcript_61083/m.164138 type:complete len:308 (+) Transcript_61083:2346-3269(+)